MEMVVQRIEWITLMFFGAMFITMECLARLGLIQFIGQQSENLVLLVDEQYRLALAIVIILSVCYLCKLLTIYSDKLQTIFMTGVCIHIVCC